MFYSNCYLYLKKFIERERLQNISGMCIQMYTNSATLVVITLSFRGKNLFIYSPMDVGGRHISEYEYSIYR